MKKQAKLNEFLHSLAAIFTAVSALKKALTITQIVWAFFELQDQPSNKVKFRKIIPEIKIL